MLDKLAEAPPISEQPTVGYDTQSEHQREECEAEIQEDKANFEDRVDIGAEVINAERPESVEVIPVENDFVVNKP